MKTKARKIEAGRKKARSLLECGGKQSTTSHSEATAPTPKRPGHFVLPAQSKILRIYAVVCCLLSAACLLAWAQHFSIDWSTIDGGGSTSTGGVYTVSGTIGQPDAGGPMTNGQYSVTGGFWALPMAVQTPGAPALKIVPAAPGHAAVSWAPAAPGWVLQESVNLATTNWVNSGSGATNPIVVPVTSPQKFYRLHKP